MFSIHYSVLLRQSTRILLGIGLLGIIFWGIHPNRADAQQLEPMTMEILPANCVLSYPISVMDMAAGRSVPSRNFKIRGRIVLPRLHSHTAVYVSVLPIRLLLRNSGNATLPVDIGGSVGYQPVMSSYRPVFVPTTSLSQRSIDIDLYGDLDESALFLNTPSGAYAGTVVITAIGL